MGSGGAFLDYDNDGDLDIYLIQAAAQGTNRLYRQEPDGRFVDATEGSGLGDSGYGMGVAVGDFDNDGRVDVYVTNYGPDVLYRNLGGGRFENVTQKAGFEANAWSSSATFCDYDADGYLDLYVAHYVAYDSETRCFKHDGRRDFCGPQEFPGTADSLYRNNGDGTFRDVSAAAGIGEVSAPGLGVVCVDLTGDGRLDFYVANDGKANQLWSNRGNGSFVDEAYAAGVALNSFGKEEAGMGIAPGDVDNDGDLDLFLTHLTNETNTLYQNDGALGFQDATNSIGLGMTAIRTTGFGTALIDIDHDGHLDIVVVNGRVAHQPALAGADGGSFWGPYAEPNVVLLRDGGRFAVVDDAEGFGAHVEVSRGLACGDVDGDGDLDLLVTSTAGPARLFLNEAPKKGRWLLVRAVDPRGDRDAHGAVVTITVGERHIVRTASPGYSYLSSNDARAHFGLPAEGAIASITVQWPDGTTERFPPVEANQAIALSKGDGLP